MMEAATTSETSVNFYKTTRRNISEHSHFQLNSIHVFQPYFSKMHFNIILPSMSRSPKWSLPFRFYDQNSVSIFHLILARCMPQHLTILELITRKIFGEEIHPFFMEPKLAKRSPPLDPTDSKLNPFHIYRQIIEDLLHFLTWLALLLHIREVPGWNLGPESGYPDWGCLWFSSVPPRKCRDNKPN
jgi:hypothetical protein